ncbi:MAG: HNH endonuclease [Candidatus Limnocylindrales bacterium]
MPLKRESDPKTTTRSVLFGFGKKQQISIGKYTWPWPYPGVWSHRPLAVGITATGRHYWVLHGHAYSTPDNLTPEEVETLLTAADLRAARRLERARTEVALATRSSRPSQDAPDRVPISDATKQSVWRRDGGKCVQCGSQRNLEFDHIIPVSMGGASTARNVQLLCEACNRAKGASL